MRSAARAWATSATMALTGWDDGPPLMVPDHVVERLDRLAAGLGVDWDELLSRRAAMLGFQRGGRVSANGSCRILPAPDGWLALNLARPDDLDLVEALTESHPGDTPWDAVERASARLGADELVARGRLLGMPAAVLADPPPSGAAWVSEMRWPAATAPLPVAERSVVDLSALWAGPLAAWILVSAGAEVVKVESVSRPDAARATPDFYGWLHPPGQQVLTLDFGAEEGREALRELLARADVVIEASRPRALEHLGTGPSSLPERPGRVWLSISGYGRAAPGRDWVAFGDDAAVAGGLVAWDGRDEPVFLGDAVADPLAGMLGARAVLDALARGGGQLIDLSMSAAAGWLASPEMRVRR